MKTNLRYTQGNSDKVYQCSIEPSADGFIVTFAYGRYGATPRTGTKTPAPVEREQAQRIFDKLLKEKLAEGYLPQDAPQSPAMTAPINGKVDAGVLPQLLNPIDEARLNELLTDHQHAAQEKYDGERCLIRKQGSVITGINRTGKVRSLPQCVAEDIAALRSQDLLIDGELVGAMYCAFDLLSGAADYREHPYSDRYFLLQTALAAAGPSILVAGCAWIPIEKKALFANLQAARKEGIVFKAGAAPYTAGRPNSGGDQLKFKFTASATCRVSTLNGAKRSVNICAQGGEPVGSVTIPANHQVPAPGDLVEVRYLYAYPGGSLIQAVYLGPRPDKTEADALASLKLKADQEDAG